MFILFLTQFITFVVEHIALKQNINHTIHRRSYRKSLQSMMLSYQKCVILICFILGRLYFTRNFYLVFYYFWLKSYPNLNMVLPLKLFPNRTQTLTLTLMLTPKNANEKKRGWIFLIFILFSLTWKFLVKSEIVTICTLLRGFSC